MPVAVLNPIWFIGWFGYLNLILTLCNLIPALPFDFGRIFRAYLASTSVASARRASPPPGRRTRSRSCSGSSAWLAWRPSGSTTASR